MAISAESTIIIDVEIKDAEARQEAAELGKSISTITARQKELAKQNQKTSVEYVQNALQVRKLTAEQKAYVNIANQADGSNNKLRAQLSILTAQYNALGKEERDNTTAGQALALQVRAISDELKTNEQRVGDNRRSVGDYTNSINSSLASQIPFANNLTVIKDALGAVNSAFKDAKAAQDAQTAATQLNTAAVEAQTVANNAQQSATEASIVATHAQTAAQEQATVAEGLRAEADRQRLLLEAQLVVAEEREAALLVQLAAEEQAVVAEERLRIATEEQLVAIQLELVAANEARIASEIAVASAAASSAAATAASTARSSAWASGLKLGGATVAAAVIAIGAASYSVLKQMDTFTDGIENDFASLKRGVQEYGSAIVRAVQGEGWSAFDGFRDRVKAATQEASRFSQVFQNLGDLTDINDLSAQSTQSQVEQLRIQARNRSLGNAEKQRLLAEADNIERGQFLKTKSLHETIIAENVEFAQQSLDIRFKLTADQKKELQQGNIQLANNLLNEGKISTDAYKKLKDAYALRNSDLQAANVQLEKIQNDQDKYSEKQKAAEEKRAAELEKINEDRIKSELATAQQLLTAREIQVQDINADIDKRVKLWKKYGQDTEQLEKERQSRLSVLYNKFATEDQKTIRTTLQQAEDIRISLIGDAQQKQFEQQQIANQRQIDETDRTILSLASRVALGEQGLTDILNAELEKRNSLVAQGDQQRAENADALRERLNTIEQNGQDDLYRSQVDALNREYELNAQRLEINQQLTSSYADLAGTISNLAGKSTIAGKIAFLAQKAFAIQQIIFNAELVKSQIKLRYEVLKTQAAFIPIGGLALIAGLTIAEGVELGRATALEAIQVGIVAASALSGFDKGGRFVSDGRGAMLPGYSKKDNINSTLRSGETVIVSEAGKDPHTASLLSAINVAYGGKAFAPGFAMGGMYAGSNAQRSALVANQSSGILDIIKTQKIYVAVTDINTEQGKYAKVVDAGTF